MSTIVLPWRRAAAAVDASEPAFGGPHMPEQVDRRLTLVELEAGIIECTAKMERLEAHYSQLEEKRHGYQLEVAQRARDLGVSDAMMMASGPVSAKSTTAGADTQTSELKS